APGEAVHDLLLARLAGAQVQGRLLAGVDAELLGARDRSEHLGGLEELLGGDATPGEAGAPDPLVLDHRDAQARRRAVQRGCVPTRSSSEDDAAELLGQG